jgi:hypothetical protein
MGPKHEFRISFPVLDQSGVYADALQALIDQGSSAAEQPRTDSYFVTETHFGLKHRNGEKLELKVREKGYERGIEFWTKTELASEGIESCKEEIASILTESGYPTFAETLTIRDSVPLTKKVCKMEFEKVKFEVTGIDVGESGTAVHHKKWVSMVIEGKKSKHVTRFLTSEPAAENLRAAIKVTDEVGGVLPVVSGYPLFVRHLAGAATAVEAGELHDTWRTVVDIVRTSS